MSVDDPLFTVELSDVVFRTANLANFFLVNLRNTFVGVEALARVGRTLPVGSTLRPGSCGVYTLVAAL